jgi:hypothetical protein
MALGTITKITNSGRPVDYVKGSLRCHLRTVQLTSGANYTTGGETVTAASVGLKRIVYANVLGLASTSSGTTSRSVVIKRQTNGSVKLLVQTTASAEAAGSSDQSTFSVDIEFIGPAAG